MIPIVAYVAAGGFAAGMALGSLLATAIVGPHEYDQGFEAGVEAQKLKGQQEMDNVRSELRAQFNEELRKAEARENERQRIQQAAIEKGRVDHAQASASVTAHELRLLGLLRDPGPGDPVRRADRGSGVPQASCAPRRAAAAPAAGQLSDGDRENLVRLAARAEQLSAQYALCLRSLPGATQ